jgi:cell division septation protein DedD
MSSTSDNETEILLGNRHLLAIFFVLAVLLGIAFTGGYMLGRNGSDKKPAALTATANDPSASTTSLETHSLAPAGEVPDPSQAAAPAAGQTRTLQPPPTEIVPAPVKEDKPLGSPKDEPADEAPPAPLKPESKPVAPHNKPLNSAFTGPQSGQTFLQVAAVGHTEADALAAVLSRKGFNAHAVAKPGSTELYRVLIGPMRDTSELSGTRDSLRNAGFTKIFVQRY